MSPVADSQDWISLYQDYSSQDFGCGNDAVVPRYDQIWLQAPPPGQPVPFSFVVLAVDDAGRHVEAKRLNRENSNDGYGGKRPQEG